MNTLPALAAGLAVAVGAIAPAHAQSLTHDRRINAEHVQFTPAGAPDIYRINLGVSMYNASSAALDLSCDVLISLNGVPLGVDHVDAIIIGGGGGQTCGGGCVAPSCPAGEVCEDFALPPWNSVGCGCSITVGGGNSNNTYLCRSGDVVRFDLIPTLAAAPELWTANDSLQLVFGLEPIAYCTVGTSSSGCTPTISANANPSITLANPCVISVSGLDGQRTGLVFYGITGPNASTWGSTSFLCVKAPTQRMTAYNSGGTIGHCDGSIAQDWNLYQATHPAALGNPFSPGQQVFAQAWYRDPAASKTTNVTNALVLLCAP